MTKDAIMNAINNAFDVSAPPASDNIVTSHDEEALDIKNIFDGKSWASIKTTDLTYENAALGLLTDSAFRYYLPAYMKLILEDIEEADTLGSVVVSQLTLPLGVDSARLLSAVPQRGSRSDKTGKFVFGELEKHTQNVAWFIRRMDKFSQAQGLCINNFLLGLSEFYRDYYDEGEPVIASQRYWFKFALK